MVKIYTNILALFITYHHYTITLCSYYFRFTITFVTVFAIRVRVSTY